MSNQQISLGALIESARAAEQCGDWDEALDGFRAAIARIQAGEEPHRGPQALRWLGRVYLERGDYPAASHAFATALADAQTLGQKDQAAWALNGMAAVEQFRGQLDAAEALYAQAAVAANEVGIHRLAASIDQNLGTLANIRGDLPLALARYESALEHFRAVNEPKHCASVLNNMGNLQKEVGEWSAAELSFNSAAQLAELTNDRATMAKVENNRAELHMKRGNYVRARECCDRAFRIYSQLGSEAGLGSVHKFFGMLYRETGKPDVAHVQFNLSLKLAKSCENPLLEAETEAERAQVFLIQRKVAPAMQSLNRAHHLFTELDARREILDLGRRLDRLNKTYQQAAEMLADEARLAANSNAA